MSLMDRIPTWLYVIVLVVGLSAIVVSSNKQPYSETEYDTWLAKLQQDVRDTATLEWSGTEPGDGIKVYLKFPVTPRQAKEAGGLYAWRFLHDFPKEKNVGVWIKDYDTMNTLHFDLYSQQ